MHYVAGFDADADAHLRALSDAIEYLRAHREKVRTATASPREQQAAEQVLLAVTTARALLQRSRS